ncbi:Cadherin-23 [Anabarilius grahami]|uniref:Cadherin-23 n=1 Tax=Anabarilius grahami TaxID=495550 RepID=A0A3N0XWU7_ANAGA|nr:Cadherin-23 [Anabarilius grahami]
MRYFAVQETTGVVWLRQPLDRETKSEMQVEFSVSDSQGVVKDTVNIQIGDVNDNSPTFHNQPYAVQIPEHFSNFNLSFSPFPIILLARPLLIPDMR